MDIWGDSAEEQEGPYEQASWIDDDNSPTFNLNHVEEEHIYGDNADMTDDWDSQW